MGTENKGTITLTFSDESSTFYRTEKQKYGGSFRFLIQPVAKVDTASTKSEEYSSERSIPSDPLTEVLGLCSQAPPC